VKHRALDRSHRQKALRPKRASQPGRERQVYEAQIVDQKKPGNLRAKIVDGMTKKFYEGRVLLEQKFLKDEKQTIGELVKELSAKTGEKISVRRFVRLEGRWRLAWKQRPPGCH
jgi:translation elongation factor EF-Ts